jgi:choline dehydrogenase-like flavoprotein
MNVIVLEAGRAIDEAVDFPPEQKPVVMNMWSRLGFALRGQKIQARLGGSFGAGLSQFYVNDRQNPYTTAPGAPFLWFRGRQVGGRLHTWARASFRMSDFEFHRPDLDESAGGDWPIRYADLESCYDKVEDTIRVVGERNGIENLPDGHVEPGTPTPGTSKVFAKLATERAGLKTIRSRVAVHNADRIPIPLARAQKTGRLVLQADAVVERILIDGETGRARGVAYRDRISKARKEVFANTVVLCASAFESTRLLLNSACTKHPGGIGASSGVLGHYISDHILVGKGGVVSGEFKDMVKADGTGYTKPSSDPYDLGTYSMYIPKFVRPEIGPQDGVDFVGGYGIQCDATSRNWWMLAFGQMEPRYENRITVNPKKKDAWGIPVAHIDVRHRENERRMAAHMSETMERAAKDMGFALREGGGRVPRGVQGLIFKLLKPMVMRENGTFFPGAAIHETGGARMGDDPKTSVVNPYCQCWDVPNLYVTDGACYPSVGYQNHTLTIMALTVRACEHILHHQDSA